MASINKQPIIELGFWLSAIAFIALLSFTPSIATSVLKITPIFFLLIAVINSSGDWRKYGIIAALVFSAIGDIFMETPYFIMGLSAFLIAHLCYIAVFMRELAFKPLRLVLVAIILSATVISAAILTPNLGELTYAVYGYMAVIATMGVAACLGKNHHPFIMLGAISFMVSDSLIAFNRFDEPMSWARYAIMATYYLAQYLLITDARANRYAT